MQATRHKVFISYHHTDHAYKEQLLHLNAEHSIFIDGSVTTGDISDDLPDQTIRLKIRDEYLRDTTVTILLVGTQTRGRKHVDWELYSSMIDGQANKRSGILALLLPGTNPGGYYTAGHENEKAAVFPETTNWIAINSRIEYENRYPYLPDRIIDNLTSNNVRLSVVPWNKLTPTNLALLVDNAYKSRTSNQYDLSRPMRRHNAPAPNLAQHV